MDALMEITAALAVLGVVLGTVYALGGWPLVGVYLVAQVPLGVAVGRRLRKCGGGT